MTADSRTSARSVIHKLDPVAVAALASFPMTRLPRARVRRARRRTPLPDQ